MKKSAILLAAVLTGATVFAQTEDAAPNRILVTNTAGNYTGYVIDYLDDISFARVDGEVLANVEIGEVGLTEMTLSVTRTEECFYYKLAVIPGVTAKQLTDDVRAIRYINSLPSDQVPVLYDDYTNATLSGITLNPESEYTIFTVGVDRYGVEAGVARADFSTPAPEITGDPHVDVEVLDASLTSFTLAFKPNDDVQSYWCVAGEKGTMQQQYEMFGPMFGFSNFSDMIKMWGIECQGVTEHTWTQMLPNTEYEVFVAMTDVNGWFAPYEVYEVSTATLGGSGDAYVDIKVGAFELTDWYGEMAPTLTISYTPNDQASCYRMDVIRQSAYDEDPDYYKQDLCSDPWMPMSGWFQYDAASYDYKIEPATSLVIIAAAKNADGVWGEVNEVRYTTPDSLEGYEPQPEESATLRVAKRGGDAKAPVVNKGVFPKLNGLIKKVELKK